MHFVKTATLAVMAIPTVLCSAVHKDQYGNDIGDIPVVNASTTIASTTLASTGPGYSVLVPTLFSTVESSLTTYGPSIYVSVPTSAVDSSNATSTIVTGYSPPASVLSSSQTDSTETLTTYTKLTTCPVTNTFVSGSSTRLETVLTTSTIVITSCHGGCSGFTIAIPTPTGNLYNVTLPSTTLLGDSSAAVSIQPSMSSSIIYANDTTMPMVTMASSIIASLSAQTTVSSSSNAVLLAPTNTTSAVPIYTYSQSSIANGSSPTLTTTLSSFANAPTSSGSSIAPSDTTSQNLSLTLLQSSSAIQLSTGLSYPYVTQSTVTDQILPNTTMSLVGPSILGSLVYGQSSFAGIVTQVSTASGSYATTGSSPQLLSSGYAVVTVPIGTPTGSNVYASYTVLTLSSLPISLGQGTSVGVGPASSSTPLVLVYGSSTTTVNGYLGYGTPTSATPMTTQAGSTPSISNPMVFLSASSSVPSGSSTVNSVATSVLANGVAVTIATSGLSTVPNYGQLPGSTTIRSTVTVSPLPYGVLSSFSTARSPSSSVGSPAVSSQIAASSTSVPIAAYGPSLSVSRLSTATTSYVVSPAFTSSSSIVILPPGAYILTTNIYGSPTALSIGPSLNPAIYSYLVAPVQGSSTSAGALPGYTPVYSPEVLGNAYGGGLVSTPTVYVSSTAGSGANGIAPGYGFSVLIVGSSTSTVYASGPSYVSTLSTNPTVSGVPGYISASTVSSSINGPITPIPSNSFQSGIPSTLAYNQGGSSSSPVGAGAAFVGAVAPSSANNGANPPLTSSAAEAVNAVPSSSSSPRGNMTSKVSPTAPAIFTGDAIRERVAWSSIMFGFLMLFHVL
ncbi:MAG: hypothetical protein M1812_000265 [Candelaria pacifica]|nr:MAG: hypothetical protein M1812_000265 [Candelaria pacifica]